MPDCFCFIVGFVNSDPQTVTIKTKDIGHQIPRPRNCIGLEVVPKTKVAKHLKEHQMALGSPHIIEVIVLAAGAHTFLYCHRP